MAIGEGRRHLPSASSLYSLYLYGLYGNYGLGICRQHPPFAAYTFMAYMVTMASASAVGFIPCGLYLYGLYSYGLYSYGLYNYGLYNYGLYSYGLRDIGTFTLPRLGYRPAITI